MWYLGLMVMVAWSYSAAPAYAAKLNRLIVAVAPLGWDTNLSWAQSRSGMLDKRPALAGVYGARGAKRVETLLSQGF